MLDMKISLGGAVVGKFTQRQRAGCELLPCTRQRATNGGVGGGGGHGGHKMGGRVLGFLNKVLDMGGHGNASQTKSCGNLHVL